MPLYPPYAGSNVIQTKTAALAADNTTTSVTFVDLLTLSVTTVANSTLLIWISYTISFTPSLSASAWFNLSIDGVEKLRGGEEEYTAAQSGAFVYRATGLSAADHTIALRWRISSAGAGTLRCRPVSSEPEGASITVMEVSV